MAALINSKTIIHPITGEYNAEGKISFPFANGGLAGLL